MAWTCLHAHGALWLPRYKNYLIFSVVSFTSGNSKYPWSGREGGNFGEDHIVFKANRRRGGGELVVAYEYRKDTLGN